MTGIVSPQGRPLISLEVKGNKVQRRIDFWLDTGFDGGLLLPSSFTDEIISEPPITLEIFLADGSSVETDAYIATVLWDGVEREVQIIVADNQPLLGLHLIRDHEIRIYLTPGGTVTIESLN